MSRPNFNQAALRTVLGYVNLSSGAFDAGFFQAFNELYGQTIHQPGQRPTWQTLFERLTAELAALGGTAPGFESVEQASSVLRLTSQGLLPEYRRFHRILLAHHSDESLFQPFFLAKAVQSVLRQEAPWSEEKRIVAGAIRALNDFIGHRPVAVLRTAQKIEPYPQEWVGPIPLYVAGAGVAVGRFHDLVSAALDILRRTDHDILTAACFDPELCNEMALDPRAYDFDHPANKRPNYQFGQWDPHTIDNSGRYRRFVLQGVTLEPLLERVEEGVGDPRELLQEAATVLAGTILMAAGTSGAGPETYDSTVSLATLLPKIAAYRDRFYEGQLTAAAGSFGERLRAEAQAMRQPLAAARRDLNARLARLRAIQLQHVHLARLFAAMGNLAASSRQAEIVPVASARVLSEIDGRISIGHLALARGDAPGAVEHITRITALLLDGIHCGALVDPWNILGFQGQFSLFPAMENSVRDHRVDVLVHLVTRVLALCVRTAAEAAAAGQQPAVSDVQRQLADFAAWWDRFATLDVSGVESVSGRESLAAAEAVAAALSDWRTAGTTAGDIAFWRKHVSRFQSPRAYAIVIETLLDKRDFVAAMGLLVQWLSEVEQVPLADGDFSFYRLAVRWLRTLLSGVDEAEDDVEQGDVDWTLAAKLFDYLEANAGELWDTPQLGWDNDAVAEDDDEGSTYEAAYEGVTYLDSTDDDVEGSTLEEGQSVSDFELELEQARLGRRLDFLRTLARLRTLAATARDSASGKDHDARSELLAAQGAHARRLQFGLLELLGTLHRYRIPAPTTAPSSLVEYDRRRRMKDALLSDVIGVIVENAAALRWLLAATAPPPATADSSSDDNDWQAAAVPLLQAILSADSEAVARVFPAVRAILDRQAILFVPLARGGDPVAVVAAQCVKQFVVELLVLLPRLGRLAEACQLLLTAMAMERHRPAGDKPITEFDRLFEVGYRALVEAMAESAPSGETADGPSAADSGGDVELFESLQILTEPLLRAWLNHSQSVRLSPLEKVADDKTWRALVAFIERYGNDLFTQRFFNLGGLRAILDSGVDAYLRRLQDESSPGPTPRLVADLDRGAPQGIDRAVAAVQLQTIIEAIVENYVEYKEFNATTTQSDHGELLYTLLDMLRVKASYERVCWNIRPVVQAHDILMRRGRVAAAELWRRALAERTNEVADTLLAQLDELSQRYRLRLPTIAARLRERFVRPLAVDTLRALVAPAVAEVRNDTPGEAFARLEQEVSELAEQPLGSGVELPSWLVALEGEAARVQHARGRSLVETEPLPRVARMRLTLAEVQSQLRSWERTANGDESSASQQ